MSKLFAVIKGELKRYFASPLAVVYLLCFLLLNSSFAMYFGGVFTSGNAGLHGMFSFIPWIYLLFVPGIAMRLWAEEFKGHTILQLVVQPVSINTYVWGKFLAAWLFCGFALALTFPFIITINVLGNPDNGVIFNSYLGAFILSGGMLALSQCASALTKNQVIALVLAVIMNLLFFLCGLEYVLGFLRGFCSEYFVETVASFSFLTIAADFNAGLLKLSSLIFFASLIIICNFVTAMIVSRKTLGVTNRLKISTAPESALAGLCAFLAFIGLNLWAHNMLYARIDWTEEKLFTPSPAAVDILRGISAPVTAKLYYSELLSQRDEATRMNFENLKQLLQTYHRLAGSKFNYRIYNPEPLSDEEDKAIAAGIQGLGVSDLNAAAYFGMELVSENGNRRVIPFFPLARSNLLEQDIIENIYLLEHKPLTLGIISGLPLMGEQIEAGHITARWQIIDELGKYYRLKVINRPDELQQVDLLLMVHPQNMSEELENAVYDFSTSGGKILAFFDIKPEVLELIASRSINFESSDYGHLPEKWGFHFYDDMAVADLENSTQINIETDEYGGTTQDLIQFYITDKEMFDDLPEVSQLKRILMTSASVFMPLKDAPIYFVPLLKTSNDAAMMPASVVKNKIHPAEILRQFKSDDQPKFLAAHIVSQQPDASFELIVVGDADMLYDSFWTSNLQIGKQNYTIPLLDNANFVLNALEILSGNEKLLPLRGKSPKVRSFAELEHQNKLILRDYKIKEKNVFDQIAYIKKGLSEIFAKRDFEERSNFTPEELSLIGKTRRALAEKKRELYEIRTELNENMQRVERIVKFFNIYLIPLIIGIIVLAYGIRNTRVLLRINWRITNRRVWIMAVISACILALGIGSYYLRKQESEDEPIKDYIFEKLHSQINDVSEIRLKNSKGELILTKDYLQQSGPVTADSPADAPLWVDKAHPQFLVNQNRIKSFLSSLLEARIYEKKSDKIENMASFGFTTDDNGRPLSAQINLFDDSSQQILGFEVGKYDVELGRGAVGAYIKLPDQFQVWLAELDLVDLDTDYHYWSFANLWNLQLGRIAAINNSSDVDFVAELTKIMLNVPLSEKLSHISYDKLKQTLNLRGEYFNRLTLDFYENDGKYYVHYYFTGINGHPLLQKFADRMDGYYELSAKDMEKIERAAAPK